MAQVWQRQCAANCYNIHCNEREYLHKQNMKIQISMHVQTHVTTYRNICVCVLNYTVRHKCGHKNLSHVSDSSNSIWSSSLYSVFWRFVNVLPAANCIHTRLRIRHGVLCWKILLLLRIPAALCVSLFTFSMHMCYVSRFKFIAFAFLWLINLWHCFFFSFC